VFRTLNIALFLALVLPLGACESAVELENAAPRVTFFAAAPAVDGVVELTVWISDQDGDPVDLEVRWAADGATSQEPQWSPGGHGVNGLTTEQGRFDPAGAPHLLRWDVSEVESSASVRFTFAPHDGIDPGLEATSPAFVPADGLDGAVAVQ
jgi:hypothetical protein